MVKDLVQADIVAMVVLWNISFWSTLGLQGKFNLSICMFENSQNLKWPATETERYMLRGSLRCKLLQDKCNSHHISKFTRTFER